MGKVTVESVSNGDEEEEGYLWGFNNNERRHMRTNYI